MAAPVDWHAFEVERTRDAGPPAPTNRERAVDETYAAALTSPGMPQLAASLDSDVHFAFPGLPEARGREAVVHAHAALFGAFDSRAFATRRIWRTASAQAIAWTMTGVQSQAWMGAPPSNKPAAIEGLTVLSTKDDGSIVDIRVYFDVAATKAQLGAGPKELAALPVPAPPQGPPEVLEQTGAPDEARNIAVTRSWLDALEKKDLPRYLALMTDDVEIHTLERAQPVRGKEEAAALFKALHKAIGQLDTTIDNAYGISRFAVVEYFLAGEQLGSLGWLPAQPDKVLRFEVADVVEVRDGKIARVFRYDNPAEVLSR
jgi:ketosteroid isomerase-like protein